MVPISFNDTHTVEGCRNFSYTRTSCAIQTKIIVHIYGNKKLYNLWHNSERRMKKTFIEQLLF